MSVFPKIYQLPRAIGDDEIFIWAAIPPHRPRLQRPRAKPRGAACLTTCTAVNPEPESILGNWGKIWKERWAKLFVGVASMIWERERGREEEDETGKDRRGGSGADRGLGLRWPDLSGLWACWVGDGVPEVPSVAPISDNDFCLAMILETGIGRSTVQCQRGANNCSVCQWEVTCKLSGLCSGGGDRALLGSVLTFDPAQNN